MTDKSPKELAREWKNPNGCPHLEEEAGQCGSCWCPHGYKLAEECGVCGYLAGHAAALAELPDECLDGSRYSEALWRSNLPPCKYSEGEHHRLCPKSWRKGGRDE